jgi:phosphoglycerol transferase MdoB-like AlkP superfamily enzyme
MAAFFLNLAYCSEHECSSEIARCLRRHAYLNLWYRRIVSLIVVYTLQRMLFIGFNLSSLETVPDRVWLLALLDGLRFDLCIIATLNIPLMVFHGLRRFAPSLTPKIWMDRFISLSFLMVNLPIIFFGIVDSRLFSFTGRRTSPAFFDILADIKGQALGILLQFWHLSLPASLALAFFCWLTWQRKTDYFHESHSDLPLKTNSRITRLEIKKNLAPITAFIAIGFLLIRGGWQTKPLGPAHAYNWQPVALANMVLNSGMTILRTPPSSKVVRDAFFSTRSEVRAILGQQEAHEQTVPLAAGKNFVVLVVESLAAEYVGFLNDGHGYTPVLDNLATQSIAFTTSFANGRRSIDAMPAIFSGIPAWRDEPFVTSPYSANELRSAPKNLGMMGYKSMFLHGAAKGSMHFDVFSKLAGFDEYIGKGDYPSSEDDDGQWGIFDEPFLQFSIDKISETKAPFLAGIFTLTSHNPFKIPAKYMNKFPKGTLPIHESIGYVDYALGQFFKTAQTKPWFNNTIFVITGDHTSLSDKPSYANMPGRFRVPIIFYDPSGALPRVSTSKIASHIDITPTILALAGSQSTQTGFFGGDLFSRTWSGRFIQQEYGTWYYNDGTCQITIVPNGATSFFAPEDFSWATLTSPKNIPDAGGRLQILNAGRQYYSTGLLDDDWFKN